MAVIEHQPTKRYERKGGLGLISEQTFKRLKRAHKHLGEEHYEKALKVLQALESRTKSKPNEKAQVLQNIWLCLRTDG